MAKNRLCIRNTVVKVASNTPSVAPSSNLFTNVYFHSGGPPFKPLNCTLCPGFVHWNKMLEKIVQHLTTDNIATTRKITVKAWLKHVYRVVRGKDARNKFRKEHFQFEVL